MGCSCKNKLKSNKNDLTNIEVVKETNVFKKIVNAILQLLFGLLVCCILSVCLVPFLIFIFYHVCTGKDIKFKVPDLSKFK